MAKPRKKWSMQEDGEQVKRTKFESIDAGKNTTIATRNEARGSDCTGCADCTTGRDSAMTERDLVNQMRDQFKQFGLQA
ncbi:MAG TPA: hypothetical protein VFC78_07470 [Tepidisphaeraceae bacterium]|nr:hypothetical protein [Tepidisphaeraceae bacterium]